MLTVGVSFPFNAINCSAAIDYHGPIRVYLTQVGQKILNISSNSGAAAADGSNRSSVPFFVVGAWRSGTTMLRLMLNRHPEIAVPFESNFIPEFYRKLSEYGDLRSRENISRLLRDISEDPFVKKGQLIQDKAAILACPITSYSELIDAIFSDYAKRLQKSRWGDKTPSNILNIGILCRLFPGCLIVHLVRDGRDVALSHRGLDWGMHSLPRVAQDWRSKVMIGHNVGDVLGANYIEVRYEDLVSDSEAVLKRLCGFLATEFSTQMLDYGRDAESAMPADSLRWHGNSIRAPDSNLVYAWRKNMSVADQIIFDENAGDALEMFGYERNRLDPTLGSYFKSVYYATLGK